MLVEFSFELFGIGFAADSGAGDVLQFLGVFAVEQSGGHIELTCGFVQFLEDGFGSFLTALGFAVALKSLTDHFAKFVDGVHLDLLKQFSVGQFFAALDGVDGDLVVEGLALESLFAAVIAESGEYEGNSMRGQLGVEVEPYEMLEMVRAIDTLEPEAVAEGIGFVKENWVFKKPCDDSTIAQGVKYALAIAKKIKERGWEAITLIDVDGMKKLEGFPPAMVFMLLEHYCSVLTVPENDVMGAVTQLIMKYISGQKIVPYMEYYEFFENSMLIGVPDFVPAAVTDGDVTVLPAAFGLLNSSLLNVSKVKTGYITCARLAYLNGWYKMHVYTAEAKTPPAWNEYGWDDPAPQLPSLEVFPDSCTVEEFAQNVCSQHVIFAYGDHVEAIKDFCHMMDIELVM